MSISKSILYLSMLGLLSGCALFKLATKGLSYPIVQGTITVEGVDHPVQINRDQYGVPHIEAESEMDAWYGLGFVHAQDRLFQIDTRRRYAFGRLSEWLGPSTIELDGFIQGLNLRHVSERIVEQSTPEVRAMLEHYAQGINAGAASLGQLPVEYRLLNATFEPWTPADCASIVLIQSWQLSENSQYELGAIALKNHVDAELLGRLFKHEPHIPELDRYWSDLKEASFGDYTKGFYAFEGPPQKPVDPPSGSNNWVVGPGLSTTNTPIMASDPHLVQSVPSLWYAAHIRGGDLNVAGVSLPSAPAIVIGHNEKLAWSLTNIMADYVDFVALERQGDNGYILAGETKEFKVRKTTIGIRNQDPVSRETLWTEVGPVVTTRDGTHVLAMRWHALEVDDQTATIFRGVNLSSSVEEAITASALPSAVAQHLLLADADGHIGLAQLGSLVNRRGFTGRLPYPGSDPSYGWDGWLEERYIEIDPDKGYLHTANSRIGYPNSERISTSYLPNSRYNRITELLESQSTFTPHDLATQQLDVQDFTAKTRLPLFLATVSPSSPAAQQCYDILIDWQYTWTKDSTAATVWAVFQRELLRQALVDDIGETGFQTYLQVVGSSRSLIAYGIEDFLQDPEKSTNLALEQTCLALQKSAGDDTKNWTWGAHHPLKLEHPFARDKKILSKWNMPTRPFGGSGSTIAAAGHGWTVENTQVGGMASMRMIMTPGGDTPARIVYPGGQSGQPGHKDYKNLFETYVNGQTVPLWFGRADVERETQHQLILQPVSAAPR